MASALNDWRPPEVPGPARRTYAPETKSDHEDPTPPETVDELRNSAAEVRAEARAWFESHWEPERPLGEWWELLARSGWGFPTWPPEWFGQGLAPELASVVDGERRRAGVPGPPPTLGTKAVAPLLVTHATDTQLGRFLLPTISGQAMWCELFSEPGAGSDLASLATRAARDGDEWVVNGQKVWSSGAPAARWGLLVARTDPDAPKHRGLTCFVLDMATIGVEVRPLRTMAGEHKFSEVFLTDVRIPDDDVLGSVGQGWPLTRATLVLERQVLGPAGAGGSGMADNNKRPDLAAPAGRLAALEQAGQQRGAILSGAGTMALVLTLLQQFGGADDPRVRQEVARLHTLVEVTRYTGVRCRAARDGSQRPDASILKLLTGRVTLALRELALRLEGPRGMLFGADAPMGAVVQKLVLTSPSMSIVAGTDEIQRTILGERVLGLPAEPARDKDVPWRQLRVGTSG